MVVSEIKTKLIELIWSEDLSHLSRIKRAAVHFARLIYAAIRDLTQGELNLRATSLVFSSLLALVPLLALSFSMLKAFGAHNNLAPFLTKMLAPLGDKSQSIVEQLLTFVSNVKVGLLGSLGLVLLIYTVVTLIRQVEAAFNQIWKTPPPKGITHRISEYLGVLLVGPVLIFAAFGMTAAIGNSAWVTDLRQIPGIGTLVFFSEKAIPYAISCFGLIFIYTFITNTKIRFVPALIGALVATSLWDLIGWLFRSFASSSNNYDAIYSGFAVGMMFLLWIYLCWFILLLGNTFAFYLQHPSYLRYARPTDTLTGRQKERIGLVAMVLIAKNKRDGRNGWTTASLASRLKVPAFTLATILDELAYVGLIQELDTTPNRWVLSQDTSQVSAAKVIASLRERDNRQAPSQLGTDLTAAENLLSDAESLLIDKLAEQNLQELAQQK